MVIREKIEELIAEIESTRRVNGRIYQIDLVTKFIEDLRIGHSEAYRRTLEENEALQIGIEAWRKKYLDNIRALQIEDNSQ